MKHLVTILLVMGCNSSTPRSMSQAPLAKAVTPPARAASLPPATPRPASLRDKVLAINGHITVLKNLANFAEYRDVVQAATQIDGVVSAEPFVFTEATGDGAQATKPTPLVVKAIEEAGVTKGIVELLMTRGRFGSLASADLPSPIVLSDGLANKLGAGVGDTITITIAQTLDPAWGQPQPMPGVFRVGGIFHVGFDQYDDQLAYVALPTLQLLLGRGDIVTGVEIRVKDPGRSGAIARELDRKLGGEPYEIADWRQLNPTLVDE